MVEGLDILILESKFKRYAVQENFRFSDLFIIELAFSCFFDREINVFGL